MVIIGLLLLAIFQVNSKAHGQVFFGGKVGLNILPAPEVAIEHPGLPVIGYQFGTTMEFVINEKLSLECEFNYSEKRVNGYVPFRNTKYFELPLNLLTTPKALRFFIGDRPAGIYLKTGIYGGQLRSFDQLAGVRATVKERCDWGLMVGSGFTCRFT